MHAQRTAQVEQVAAIVKLKDLMDVVVGGRSSKRLANGDRRRLHIGCEIIHLPPLIFLDDPTKNLDFFRAEGIVNTLLDLAREKRSEPCLKCLCGCSVLPFCCSCSERSCVICRNRRHRSSNSLAKCISSRMETRYISGRPIERLTSSRSGQAFGKSISHRPILCCTSRRATASCFEKMDQETMILLFSQNCTINRLTGRN